jgi:hypothetical protein
VVSELPIRDGDNVLVVRGDLAGPDLADGLQHRGAVVDDVVAYRTLEAPPSSRSLLREAMAGHAFDAVLFTSGSTVRGDNFSTPTGRAAGARPRRPHTWRNLRRIRHQQGHALHEN